jgi:SAM-dependent methyltransferase
VDFASRLNPKAEIQALLSSLEGSRRILDVGGGTGLLTQAIAARFGSCTVVEPDQDNAAQINPGQITVLPGRAEALPFEDESFDAVIATWVLQYTSDPRIAVREMCRVCRKESGSRIVIIQAAPENDIVDLYNVCAETMGLPQAHHGFLLAVAAELLEKQGFTGIELSRINIPWDLRDLSPELRLTHAASIIRRLHDFPEDPTLVKRVESALSHRPLWSTGVLNDDGILLMARRP